MNHENNEVFLKFMFLNGGFPQIKMITVQSKELKHIRSDIFLKFGISSDLSFYNKYGIQIFDEVLPSSEEYFYYVQESNQDFNIQMLLEDYQIIKLLGQGGYGKVLQVKHFIDGKILALKIVNYSNVLTSHSANSFKEALIIKGLNHPNIIQLYNAFMKNGTLYLLMEYIKNGSLFSFLKPLNSDNGLHYKNSSNSIKPDFEPSSEIIRNSDSVEKNLLFSEVINPLKNSTLNYFSKSKEGKARKIFTQIIDVLSYCHERKIAHRDLKLENIMISNENDLTIKVIDFGIASIGNESSTAGTIKYLAPECFTISKRSPFQQDIWASGIVLYLLLVGDYPFNGAEIKSVKKSIQFDELKRIPNISGEANDLLAGLLRKDPKKRLTINEIKDHPWIKGEKLNFIPNYELSNYECITNSCTIIPLSFQKSDIKSIMITDNSQTLELSEKSNEKEEDKERNLVSLSISRKSTFPNLEIIKENDENYDENIKNILENEKVINKKSSINLFDNKSNKTVINEILIRHGKIELLYPPEILINKKGRKSSSVIKQYGYKQTPSPHKKNPDNFILPKIQVKLPGSFPDNNNNRVYSRNSTIKLTSKHKSSINTNFKLNKITEFSSSPSKKHLSLIHMKNNS